MRYILVVVVVALLIHEIGKAAWDIAEDFEEGWRDNDQDND